MSFYSSYMNAQAVSVSFNHKYPRIYIKGKWLAQMGFVSDALFHALPEPGGLVIKLCDENVSYKELLNQAVANGGKLIFGCYEDGISLVAAGDYVCGGGLKVGDACIAHYQCGIIRIRKIPPHSKIIASHKGTSKVRRVSGRFLADNGFTQGAIMTAAVENGKITFNLQEQTDNFSALVNHARANRLKLLQVSRNTELGFIKLSDSFLEKAGFDLNDTFLARYGYGSFTLSKLDLKALGF